MLRWLGLSVGDGVDWLPVEREGKREAIWKTEVSEEDEGGGKDDRRFDRKTCRGI